MPESRVLKSKLGKVYHPASGRPYTESGAAVNKGLEPANNRSLPRLRSEVPSGPKGIKNNHINTFLPRYLKLQKDRTSKVGQTRLKPTSNMEVLRASARKDPPHTEAAVSPKGTQHPAISTQVSTQDSISSNQGQQGGVNGSEMAEKLSTVAQIFDGTPMGKGSPPQPPPAEGKVPPPLPPPQPPPSEGNISLADIMLKLNSLADMPSKINDIADDLKQIKVLQEQTTKIGQEIVNVQGQVSIMEEKVSKLQDKETETQQHLELLAKEILDLKAEVKQLKQESPSTKEIVDLKAEVKQLKQESPSTPQSDFELLKVKADMLKQNLIVEGIREPQVDSYKSAYYQARSFVRNTLDISYAGVDRAYRLGKRRGDQSQPRPLLIRFTRLGDRMDAWEARYKLNSTDNLFIKEDLPIPLRPVQAALVRVAQAARKKSRKYPNVLIRDFRLHINDTSYGVEDLEKLPNDIRPSSIATPGNSQVVIFFGRDSRFSNHHPSKFVLQDITYSSIEQYLADKRATLAGKQDLRDKALASDDPHEAKKILNALHGDPSDEEWATQRRDVLFDGLLAKFQQNDKLKEYLLSSGQRTLGEASRNKTWGTGLTLSDNGRLDPRNWTGENLLGTNLMEVRQRLRDAIQPIPPHQGEEVQPELGT